MISRLCTAENLSLLQILAAVSSAGILDVVGLAHGILLVLLVDGVLGERARRFLLDRL